MTERSQPNHRYMQLNTACISNAAREVGLIPPDTKPVLSEPSAAPRNGTPDQSNPDIRIATDTLHSAAQHATVLVHNTADKGRIIATQMSLYGARPAASHPNLDKRIPDLDLTVYLSRGGKGSKWWDHGVSVELLRDGKFDSRYAGPVGDKSGIIEKPTTEAQKLYNLLASKWCH